MSGEKTEKPTQKKLQKARKDGQATAHTPEIGSWAATLVASFVLPIVLTRGVRDVRELFVAVMATVNQPEPARALALLRMSADAIVGTVLPLFISSIAVALIAHAAQGGIRPAPSLLKPQLKRMNPFSGIKRMVGPHAMWEVTKVIVKTILLGFVVWQSLRDVLPLLTSAGRLPLASTMATVGETVITLMRNAAAAGLVMAFADYAVARKRTNKGLRMSKQDIKDEYKQSEGDPHVKAHIRSRQMAMSRNRMMSDVAAADVVVVNPVHVAVALKYEAVKGAPRVVAKGAGAVAARIREEAEKHRVPMVENVPLARGLYKSCDIGQEIPAETYAAVAQVLAFVLALKARGSAAGLHRPAHLSGAQ